MTTPVHASVRAVIRKHRLGRLRDNATIHLRQCPSRAKDLCQTWCADPAESDAGMSHEPAFRAFANAEAVF